VFSAERSLPANQEMKGSNEESIWCENEDVLFSVVYFLPRREAPLSVVGGDWLC
jgi:hypothetical protein